MLSKSASNAIRLTTYGAAVFKYDTIESRPAI